MLKFIDEKLRVRCTECKELNIIQIGYVDTDKEQRNIGVEYEHLYRGKTKCNECETKLRITASLYEFPEGMLNYYETNTKNCYLINDITEASFKICNE